MLVVVARIAFGVFFAGSAILKFGATATMTMTITMMLATAGFSSPLPFVYFAAAAQTAGGVALIAGRLVGPAAFGSCMWRS